MRYAVIDKKTNINNKYAIKQIIVTEEQVVSIADLQVLPGFNGDVIDFTMAELIEITDSITGEEFYNPVTKQFDPPRKHILTKLELIQRLTPTEQVLLFFPDDAQNVSAEAKMPLKLFAKQIELANFIDLDRPDTVAGLEQLEQIGLLEHGRVLEIRGIADE